MQKTHATLPRQQCKRPGRAEYANILSRRQIYRAYHISARVREGLIRSAIPARLCTAGNHRATLPLKLAQDWRVPW